MVYERDHYRDEAANHKWPIASAFWIIRIVSVEGCSSLTQNLMQICWSTCSVILHVMATQYTWSLKQHLPSSLTSAMKSSLFTHAHSSSLSWAARLHWCHANHFHYIKNGWSFSRQTLYYLTKLRYSALRHPEHSSWINLVREEQTFLYPQSFGAGVIIK